MVDWVGDFEFLESSVLDSLDDLYDLLSDAMEIGGREHLQNRVQLELALGQ